MGDTSCALEWLTKSLLETVLRSKYEDSDVTVTSFDTDRATAAGDNYSSNMHRVIVHFTSDNRPHQNSLIVKEELMNEEIRKAVEKAKIVDREGEALKTTVPDIYQLLEDAAPGRYEPFSAKCYYLQEKPLKAMILEDLKEKGFRIADRTRGLDLQHCLLVMKTLARFHAASAVLHHKYPQSFTQYGKMFNEDRRELIQKFYEEAAGNVAKQVDKWPDYKDLYSAKIYELSEEILDFLIEDTKIDDANFNVFVHGDLWMNNIMFRYSEDTGEVVDIRFVDFQLSHLADATQDLQYFLYTTPQLDLVDKHDFLVEEYHGSLGETFTLLGHEELHPSLEKLQKQFSRKGRFGVAIACTVLPIMVADRNHVPDMSKIVTDEETLHFSDQYKETIKKLLPVFVKKGWL